MASAEEVQQMLSAMQVAFVEALAKQQQASNDLRDEIVSLKQEVESIKSKSAMAPPQILLTPPESNDLRFTDKEPASGNGLFHANQTQSPPTRKERSERLPNPDAFTGKRAQLPEFLYALSNKLKGNADRYPEDNDKLQYALTRIKGEAAALVNPFEPTTLETLLGILEASYGDPNQQATAQRKLQSMSQGTTSFPAYFSRFHRHAKISGWNDTALISRLIESLNAKLAASLIGVELPDKLETCANLINKRYNDILRLAPKSPTRHSTPRQRHEKALYTVKDPDAMEIDAVSNSYAPIGSAERKRREQNKLCFKCGSGSHLSFKCDKPMPSARIRAASLNRLRSPRPARNQKLSRSRSSNSRKSASSVLSSRASSTSDTNRRSSRPSRSKGRSRN